MTFRPDQAKQFAVLADAVRGLDDSALVNVKLSITRLLHERLENGDDWLDPIPQTFCALSDVLTVEINHRLATIWNTRADLQGGHHVIVTNDLHEVGTFQAACWPVWTETKDVECWVGPPRATFEEAEADGRRHNPGFDPVDHRTPSDG